MKGRMSVLVLAVLILGLVIVPGFTADSDDPGQNSRTYGCGAKKGGDSRLSGSRISHLYFRQAEVSDGVDCPRAWAKMAYTICGEPSRFVFKGSGLECNSEYELVFADDVADGAGTPETVLFSVGAASSDYGGNIYIKGSFPPVDLSEISFSLIHAGGVDDMVHDEMDVVLVGEEAISYALTCPDLGLCDLEIFSADLAGVESTPGGTVEPLDSGEATGKAIFAVGPWSDRIYYKLVADNAGTVIAASIVAGGDPSGVELVPIYPSEREIDLHGHDLIALGVIDADDSLNQSVLGTNDTIGSLIGEVNTGTTYVSLITEGDPGDELRGDILPADCSALMELWNLHVDLWDWGCGNRWDHDRGGDGTKNCGDCF